MARNIEDDKSFITLQVRFTGEMLGWIDKERSAMALRPSRAQFVRYLVNIAQKKIEADGHPLQFDPSQTE